MLALSTETMRPSPRRRSRDGESQRGDPFDFLHRVDARVVRHAVAAATIAEVDAARQLAHDHHVGASRALLAQRAGGSERRHDPYRPQVGEQAEALAQAEQTLLRAWCVGVGRVPLRPAHGAQQHGVGCAAAFQHLGGQRDPVLVDRDAADRRPLDLEAGIEPGRERVQELQPCPDHLGTDPVARQDDDFDGSGYGPPAAASSWACSTWSTRSLSSERSCCTLLDVLRLLLLVVGDLLQLVLDVRQLRVDVAGLTLVPEDT